MIMTNMSNVMRYLSQKVISVVMYFVDVSSSIFLEATQMIDKMMQKNTLDLQRNDGNIEDKSTNHIH